MIKLSGSVNRVNACTCIAYVKNTKLCQYVLSAEIVCTLNYCILLIYREEEGLVVFSQENVIISIQDVCMMLLTSTSFQKSLGHLCSPSVCRSKV